MCLLNTCLVNTRMLLIFGNTISTFPEMKNSILALLLCFCCYIYGQENIRHCDSLIDAGIKKSDAAAYPEALALLTEAQNLAQKNNWPKQLFLAKNNIGTCYFSALDYGEALKYYFSAYNIAVKSKDAKQELMALNNIAILYTREEAPKKAYHYFKKAYDISKNMNDSLGIGIYALNVGLVMNALDDMNASRTYLEESLRYAKRPGITLVARVAIAENEMALGHTASSRKMALQLLNEIPDKTGDQNAVSLFLVISKCYIHEKKYKEAEDYAYTALKYNTDDLSTTLTIYKTLDEIAVKSNRLQQAMVYKDSAFAILGRLDDIKNGRAFEENRVKFELQDYKNEIAHKEATIKQERNFFYAILGGMASVILLIFFIFRNRSIRHQQKKLLSENRQQQLELELTKKESEALLTEKKFKDEQHETLLEQERLKNEIEYKNRKLSSQALVVTGKYQMIEDVISLLSEQPELTDIPAVKKHIRFLRNSLKPDNEWENFLTHFEEVNQGFLIRLKAAHPALTANDIRFICYVYMNLNAKEIATMLNISLDAGRKRKERIAQKLGLPDSTALYSYLSEIQAS